MGRVREQQSKLATNLGGLMVRTTYIKACPHVFIADKGEWGKHGHGDLGGRCLGSQVCWAK